MAPWPVTIGRWSTTPAGLVSSNAVVNPSTGSSFTVATFGASVLR